MRIIPIARKARELARGREVLKTRPPRGYRWASLAIVFLLTVLVTTPSLWHVDPFPSEVGAQISEPIRSAINFQYLSPDAEVQWEEERKAQHARVFIFDSTVGERAKARLDRALDAAEAVSLDDGTDAGAWREKLALVDDQFGSWTTEEVDSFVRLAHDQRFRRSVLTILNDLYRDYVITLDKILYLAHKESIELRSKERPPESSGSRLMADRLLDHPEETIATVRTASRTMFAMLYTDPPLGSAATTVRLLRMVIEPNLVFSDRETSIAYNNYPKAELVENYSRGNILVPRPKRTSAGDTARRASGEDEVRYPYRLRRSDVQLLAEYSKSLRRVNFFKLLAQVGFVLAAFVIVGIFARKFGPMLDFGTQTTLLLSLPVLLALFLGRLFLFLLGSDIPTAGFAFPAGAIGILGVLLLDVRMALLLVTWGCLLFGLEVDLDYQYVIVGLFGGYTAVAALFTFRERREVLFAGLLIGLVNSLTIIVIKYLADPTHIAWSEAAVGALSGIASPLISFAILPVFEVAFHVTTDMRLLELSGLQHPLLRRMEEVAPGTWQHTLNVTKLAESAASAIGVNYLLVRAGCYFHDIGKMSRPEYFTENQITPEDRALHGKQKPQMSTLIIKNHVKEGMELAREYRLPKIVADFIPQHHGTTVIQYFYNKALTAYERGESKDIVREEEFRYPGPKPQTIEAAILMLADTVEATATARLSNRAVRDDDIQMLVRNSIFEKFNDGQFDHCNLTMRDLNTIRESFVKTLRSRFHTRIDYPGDRKERERTSRDTQSMSRDASREVPREQKPPTAPPASAAIQSTAPQPVPSTAGIVLTGQVAPARETPLPLALAHPTLPGIVPELEEDTPAPSPRQDRQP